MLELEFYTSEFCVGVDPELVESKIYGLPLAMQGVVWGEGGVCVCVVNFRWFFCEIFGVFFRCFFGGADICVGFKTDIYIYIYVMKI